MKILMAAAALLLSGAAPVLAANVDQPYQNIDKRNDAGNNTGNSNVDTLNRGQLDENQKNSNPALGGTTPPARPAPGSSGG